MPFVQRVVQPTRLALASASSVDERTRTAKFHCTPGKCKNNNCINKQGTQQQQTPQLSVEHEREEACIENGGVISRTTLIAKDTAQQQQQQHQLQQHSRSLAATPTAGGAANHITTVTRAIIHVSQQNGDTTTTPGLSATKTTATSAPTTPMRDVADCTHHYLHRQQQQQQQLQHNQTNGYTCSFSYATDTEDEISVATTTTPAAPVLSLKKLKHHVEFLSTASSPTRSASAGDMYGQQQQQQHQTQRHLQLQHLQRQRQLQQQQRTQSPTAAKIVSGHEFESISNLTLSNALRQLASLVLLASDIFDELQSELLSVGERARNVQRKVITVEQRVTAYDPKMVTVPESDLLTFAQRKTHFECDQSIRKELFTTTTRPPSVRVLYEEAARVRPTPAALAYHSPHSPCSFTSPDGTTDGAANTECVALLDADDCDELVCTPVFGKTNRKMRTRIDAEIEIRLPAAIEDLRKWTSSEALGDMTVTPDCMHHVDTSISTSMVIGDNGVLTPALSPSVLSADAVDALYAINVSQIGDNTQLPNDINKDVPLNHRLPSPEEQCKIIALRYPAEVISVDTSGKRFQRMCAARKSTTGCYTSNMAETNNLNDDVQTVSRRSRSRRVRGKRRNTIAGTDQKEIQDAANGDSATTSSEIKNTLNAATAAGQDNTNVPVGAAATADGNDEDVRRGDKSKKFGRSKSSDILKKDAVALPYDKGKSTLTRLNSLKQWGRNRFKFMQRTETTVQSGSDSGAHDVSASSSSNSSQQQHQPTTPEKVDTSASNNNNATNATHKASQSTRTATGDIDDECVVHELVSQKSEGRFSHERKPSYSSSEKSMSVSSSGHLKGKLHLATCGNVKLRDTSSLNRQRRLGINNNGALGGKDEQPHSSSGNWSASSESGRASIGSEITIQPKSSASNTSLNVSSFHPGSGPPSSMMSRRRFLNTSASSSVTSEGTATPDLQVADGSYPNHLDDETSSAYSCDTEGYYTSFHMDSGLRTLKEEDPPMTPLQHNQMLHTSNYSFGSQSNQTVLTAENEYELFGKGSTSTTTSSAGTVCTTLQVGGEQSSLNSLGPDVPERISSLGKLNKNNHSNSASTSTLERSYSSSTIGSTLERTGTIKRNVNAGLKLNTTADVEDIDGLKGSFETPESQEDEFDFEKRIRRRSAQPLPAVAALSEVECSESSDLEGVERIERIKQKTAINAKRIPSMCIITPTTSDDENQSKDGGDDYDDDDAYDPDRTLTPQSSPRSKAAAKPETTLKVEINEVTGYCTVDGEQAANKITESPLTPTKGDKDHNLNLLKRNSNYAFNMFEKLKVVLPSIKRSPSKSSQPENVVDDDELYDTAGEYVTIADISNNNRHNQLPVPKAVGASSLGIYYSNDIVRRKLDIASASASVIAAAKANEPAAVRVEARRRETEYVSLNELPQHLRKVGSSAYSSSAALSATANNESAEAHDSNATHQQQQQKDKTKETTPIRQPPAAAVHCAESAQQRKTVVESAAVPMYAEISEVREQSTVSPLTQHKGARVRLNSQGKIIYDSDSLKRRKGAHTTFAPGPYVKETESALPEITSVNAQAYTQPVGTAQQAQQLLPAQTPQSQLGSESANAAKANISVSAKTTAAKLLLLNGGVAATRKIANVRPILAKSPLTLARQQQTASPQQQQQTPTHQSQYTGQSANNQANMSLSSGLYEEPHAALAYSSSYQDNKNMLANNTNPFFQPNIITAAAPTTALMMMPSPSTKSTSSTGSTISSSASTNTSSGASSASSTAKEEGKQILATTTTTTTTASKPQMHNNCKNTTLITHTTFAPKNTTQQQQPTVSDVNNIVRLQVQQEHIDNALTDTTEDAREIGESFENSTNKSTTIGRSSSCVASVPAGEKSESNILHLMSESERHSQPLAQAPHYDVPKAVVGNHESMCATRMSFKTMLSPPPPLPPRGRAQPINGVADARSAFPSAAMTSLAYANHKPPTPPPPPPHTTPTANDISATSRVGDDDVVFGVDHVPTTHGSKRISISATVDPIAATQQFSISTDANVETSTTSQHGIHITMPALPTSSSPAPSPTPPLTSTPTQRRPALKRNNSYRLANDEVKLEMNKENLLQIYAEDNSSLTITKATFLPSTQSAKSNSQQQQNQDNNNSQCNSHTLPHASGAMKLKNATNNLHVKSIADNGEKGNGQRKMTKSFERLVDEFSLSTTSIDSSYLRNKSLENFDESPSILNNNIGEHKMAQSEVEDSDSEPELELSPPPSHTKFHKSFIESVLLKPFKVVRPTDENDVRRQRILQKFEVTEIW